MTIQTLTYEGVPGGMNLALPAQELDDTEARYIQDGLVDKPGIVRRRGPLTPVAGMAALTRKGTGIIGTLNPQGSDRYGVLNGDAVNGYFTVFASNLATAVDLAWPHPLPTTPANAGQAYRYVDSHPALHGGVMIGVSSAYDAAAPNQALALWYGATKANYNASGLTLVRGSSSVTGSGFSANVDPGMFLFANTDDPYSNAYIGVVKTVDSDTALTLVSPSPYSATSKAGTFEALRGLTYKITKGRITCDTSSATVTGGNTRFKSQKMTTGTWDIYRASDMTWVGKVSSIQSETALTLAANAAVALSDESFVALRADADFNIVTTANVNKVGWITATYADRQWYFNNGSDFSKTSRGWFSDTNDPEALDIADFDGDWVDVISSSNVNEPIRAAVPAFNGLVVLKESEAFIITGSSPDSFAVRKLEDDGTLAGMSAQPYGGGVIWAGREGIHFYDGTQVTNLVATKLGDYWKTAIRSLDPTKYRMWSMIDRDHYMLFIESINPTVSVVKGNTSVTPTKVTVTINLVTRAITFLENVDIRGSVVLPASVGRQTWFLVNSSSHAYVLDGEALFTQEGNDQVIPDGSAAAGPDFYMESKKFDAADSLRLKRFKQLALYYLVQGDTLKVDTITGLNEVGLTLTTTLPATVYTWDSLRTLFPTWNALKAQFPTWNDVIQSVYLPKRLRFQKKTQHFAFRVYQNSSTVSRLQLGPYQIGFKEMRPGRV